MTAIRHRSPSPWTARWLAVAIVVAMAVLIGGISVGVRVFGPRTEPRAQQAAAVPAATQDTIAAPTVGGAEPGPPTPAPPTPVPDVSPTVSSKAAPTSAATPARPAAPRTPSRPAPTPDRRATTGPASAGVQADVLALVNAERAKVQCSPLTLDARLNAAAHGHSADMAARGYFAHETQGGGGMSTRVTNAGYRWSAVAENIAMGQSDPAAVMKGWMESTGHRANILNCRYRHLGVGMVANARGTRYWTQNFATPA